VESALSFHPDGILVTVPERGEERVLLVNRAMESMLGIRASGLLGRPLAELRGRLEERFPAGSAERLLGDARCDTTETFEAPGDPPTVIQRTSRPLGDPGFHGGRLVSFRDLTAEKTRVEELRRAAEEAEGARASLEKHHEQILMANEGLEKRISDLGRFNREMRTLDEMKSNLLANVSHELQTPLVSIRGYTEMILKGRLGPLTEEQERGLQVALRNVDRLIALLDGLLSFVRTERESAPLRIEVFPLKPLVEEVLTLLRTSAEEKAVNVTAQFPSGDLSIKADRARISQVFINLLTNAIKYNRGGGSVAVEATRGHRATARVEIRDTGVGIPREDLDRVFERFYRGERGKGRGSGLGLAITKDILRMHGCMIRADSEPGKGSTFSFTLPLEFRGRAERSARVTPDRQDG
jgi:signal transduction histidine kinase